MLPRLTSEHVERNKIKKMKVKNADVECLYCGNTYLQSNEGWVQCRACLKWAHCSCAGEYDNDDELYHICDIFKV